MNSIHSISGSTPFVGYSDESLSLNFEQCAKKINVMIRASLRDWAREIEVFRELEEKEQEEATRARASSYRSIVPTILRIGTAAIGGLNIGAAICPGAARHCYELVSSGAKTLSAAELTKSLSQNIAAAQEFCKAGVDIKSNYDQADRTELEAKSRKAQELFERRAKEAHERRTESDELLQLLQQINREIAESIRAIVRN